MRDLIHFEHRPGLTDVRQVSDWSLVAFDDLGNRYAEAQLGGYEKVGAGAASFGERDLALIAPEAVQLTLELTPARESPTTTRSPTRSTPKSRPTDRRRGRRRCSGAASGPLRRNEAASGRAPVVARAWRFAVVRADEVPVHVRRALEGAQRS